MKFVESITSSGEKIKVIYGSCSVGCGFDSRYVTCKACRFRVGGLHANREMCECILTGFVIANPEMRDIRCPLKFDEEDK